MPAMSDAEREVLKVLWEHGAGTVREINEVLADQGRRWAYTTVITLLQRLQAKGYVASDKSGFAHVFHAAVTRDAVVQQHLTDLVDDLCDGTAAPLVLALVQRHQFSDEEIEQFRQLIDELESRKTKDRPRQC
jgi:predicted transcriptional regulator